jgi:hypothetical protein
VRSHLGCRSVADEGVGEGGKAFIVQKERLGLFV